MRGTTRSGSLSGRKTAVSAACGCRAGSPPTPGPPAACSTCACIRAAWRSHSSAGLRLTPGAASDWVELAPHSAHTHTVDITSDYAFRSGDHTYELRYAGLALGDIHQLDVTTPLVTDTVMFRHIAP